MFGPSGPTLTSARLERLEADRGVLASVLPGLNHYIWASGEGALAEGVVDIDIGAGCWKPVQIRMEFGPDHPKCPPRVYDHGRRWKPDPDRHLMFDFEFCLSLAYVDTPDVSTSEGFREFMLRLVPFLRDQFVFDDIGRWPGPEWPHGARAAYAQHLVERLSITSVHTLDDMGSLLLGATQRPDRACPCRSGLPYGRCHRPDIEALRWVRRLTMRDQIPDTIKEHLRHVA